VPSEPSSTPPASHGVEKQQNIYELRSELQRKEAAEDKKAKEMVAQSALKEMPLSGSGGETASAGSTGKHTIVSLLAPEGKKQQEKPSPDKTTSKPTPMTPKDKTSATPKPQQEASVTSKPLKPATEAEKTGSSTSDREASYWIQVGAYREEANAKKVKGLIDALGYEAILKQSSHPKLGTIYIVRVPIKGSKADAQKAISVISQKTGDKPFLMEAR
jgi:cell division protein FtsN